MTKDELSKFFQEQRKKKKADRFFAFSHKEVEIIMDALEIAHEHYKKMVITLKSDANKNLGTEIDKASDAVYNLSMLPANLKKKIENGNSDI